MKKLGFGLAFTVLMAGVGVINAGATGLVRVTGFYTGTVLSAGVGDNLLNGTVSTGAMKGFFDPNSTPSTGDDTPVGPLYCIDLEHSFAFGQQWDVTCYTIPPDFVPNPPPYNTAAAAYIFINYGLAGASSSVLASGVQLALWEVTHEDDWLSVYGSTTWMNDRVSTTDDFYLTSANSSAVAHATTILSDLASYGSSGPSNFGQARYYDPEVPPSSGRQGFVGAVPEPGTLGMLGLGLLLLAGAATRKKSG